MTFGEFLERKKNINNDVLFYACFKAIEDIKQDNFNNVFNKYIDIALQEKQEYDDAQRIINKLTENNKNDSNYKPSMSEMLHKMCEEIKRKSNN